MLRKKSDGVQTMWGFVEPITVSGYEKSNQKHIRNNFPVSKDQRKETRVVTYTCRYSSGQSIIIVLLFSNL